MPHHSPANTLSTSSGQYSLWISPRSDPSCDFASPCPAHSTGPHSTNHPAVPSCDWTSGEGKGAMGCLWKGPYPLPTQWQRLLKSLWRLAPQDCHRRSGRRPRGTAVQWCLLQCHHYQYRKGNVQSHVGEVVRVCT